ncbi:MAG: hypothetical protein PHV30_01945 [Candidatus Margulisbacteria bacterium]|nr:hypothetical protein [Candidatus Margulisiibacteriota bacterium]
MKIQNQVTTQSQQTVVIDQDKVNPAQAAQQDLTGVNALKAADMLNVSATEAQINAGKTGAALEIPAGKETAAEMPATILAAARQDLSGGIVNPTVKGLAGAEEDNVVKATTVLAGVQANTITEEAAVAQLKPLELTETQFSAAATAANLDASKAEALKP